MADQEDPTPEAPWAEPENAASQRDEFLEAAQEEEQRLLELATLRAQAEYLGNRAVLLNAALRRRDAGD